MTRVVVNPGNCGMTAVIEVVRVGKRKVGINLTSSCEIITRMSKTLAVVDGRDCLKPCVKSEVYQCASECHVHASCSVPLAILKAVEVEAELALPAPVMIKFETIEKK